MLKNCACEKLNRKLRMRAAWNYVSFGRVGGVRCGSTFGRSWLLPQSLYTPGWLVGCTSVSVCGLYPLAGDNRRSFHFVVLFLRHVPLDSHCSAHDSCQFDCTWASVYIPPFTSSVLCFCCHIIIITLIINIVYSFHSSSHDCLSIVRYFSSSPSLFR